MPLPENIAAAAARLVALHGPDGFTMEDLAREAGLSRATLYRQVGGREAILAALAGQGVDIGRRVDVRQRILEACRVVFGRAGFEAATLEEVAREAGVGAATLYRQFGDKEGLISTFLDQVGPRRALKAVALHPTGELRTDLERMAAAVLREAAEDMEVFKLGLMERLRGGPWEERLQASPWRSVPTVLRLLEPHVASGVLSPEDPRRLAQVFVGLLIASLMGRMLGHQPPPDPEETARFLTHVFLDGALASNRRSHARSPNS